MTYVKALSHSSQQKKNGNRYSATANHHLTMTTVWLIKVEAINVNANKWRSAEEQDIGIISEYLPPNMNQFQRERVNFRWRDLADVIMSGADPGQHHRW